MYETPVSLPISSNKGWLQELIEGGEGDLSNLRDALIFEDMNNLHPCFVGNNKVFLTILYMIIYHHTDEDTAFEIIEFLFENFNVDVFICCTTETPDVLAGKKGFFKISEFLCQKRKEIEEMKIFQAIISDSEEIDISKGMFFGMAEDNFEGFIVLPERNPKKLPAMLTSDSSENT